MQVQIGESTRHTAAEPIRRPQAAADELPLSGSAALLAASRWYAVTKAVRNLLAQCTRLKAPPRVTISGNPESLRTWRKILEFLGRDLFAFSLSLARTVVGRGTDVGSWGDCRIVVA